MREARTILVVDDDARDVKFLADLLEVKGYEVLRATSGLGALELVETQHPDLVLLDVLMPEMDGYEVCRRIRDNEETAILPVVMVTALDPSDERVKGIEAGADDFLAKPINQPELMARVRSLLRIKELFETVKSQAAELEEWNRTLEEKVQQQVSQIQRLARFRHFLSPQVAQLIEGSGDDSCLQSHRREIAILFCDLRDFTAFSETADPEEVMRILTEYHEAMGALVFEFDGTIDHRAGDGMMIFFNDPLPCNQPAGRAVRMAIAMRKRMGELIAQWKRQGHDLGFGVGISMGYATIGLMGFEGRFDYAATGSAVNLASRLCDHAKHGQILVSQRVHSELEGVVDTELVDNLQIRGFHRPVATFNVLCLRDLVLSGASEKGVSDAS